MVIMGETMDDVEFPVCNKFRPRILSGQLCYSVDVNEFKDQIETKKLRNGLVLLIDYKRGRMLRDIYENRNRQNSTLLHILVKMYDEQCTLYSAH